MCVTTDYCALHHHCHSMKGVCAWLCHCVCHDKGKAQLFAQSNPSYDLSWIKYALTRTISPKTFHYSCGPSFNIQIYKPRQMLEHLFEHSHVWSRGKMFCRFLTLFMALHTCLKAWEHLWLCWKMFCLFPNLPMALHTCLKALSTFGYAGSRFAYFCTCLWLYTPVWRLWAPLVMLQVVLLISEPAYGFTHLSECLEHLWLCWKMFAYFWICLWLYIPAWMVGAPLVMLQRCFAYFCTCLWVYIPAWMLGAPLVMLQRDVLLFSETVYTFTHLFEGFEHLWLCCNMLCLFLNMSMALHTCLKAWSTSCRCEKCLNNSWSAPDTRGG